MIRNYIRTAFRSLMKNKGFTLLNVLGLALGLATCMLIVFYVYDELGYDAYNAKADRVYRVNNDIRFGGATNSYAVVPAPVAAAMKNDLPDIEQVTRFRTQGGFLVRKGTQNIQENAVVYADPAVFSVFTLPMIDGSPSTALIEPHSIVIDELTAKKYFNSTRVVGKVMTFNDTAQYKITGVIKDIPKQSHFNFDIFISMSTLPESRDLTWLSSNFATYILLRPGVNLANFESRLQPFYVKHAEPELQAVLHSNFKQFERTGDYIRVNLMPLKDIHLHSNKVAELGANGNIEFVYIFSAIAAFILLIACVNFMNLSTARSSNRAKEVGVRKVLGSARKQLILQFLIESVMVTLTAAVIALFIAYALLPVFNQLSGKELSVTLQLAIGFLPVLMVLVLVIGCLAGSYPALFLSGFNPIEVLKGKLASGFKGGFLRSSLVVLQFSISIFLIIGTLVIYNQLRYIQHKDIGYSRDHILMVNDAWTLGGAASTLKTEIQQLAGVESVSLADAVPTWNYGNQTTFFKSQSAVLDQKQALNTQFWGIDENYIPTLGMKIETGRNFSASRVADSSAIIINEAAAKQLGFANPLDKIIYKPLDNGLKVLKPLRIIGVVKDFNFRSLRENVTAMVFTLDHGNSACTVRIKSTDIPRLLAQIKEKWNTLSPHHEFGYSFMEQDFDSMYRSEQQTGKIAVSFTSMAIIIASLGLFGLAAYAAEQRTKEIGIRKVLGAGVNTIVNMLSMDFIKLVLIAIIIATPLAWYGMQMWLKGFVYKQDIQWWVPAVAGLAVVVVAFATISFQSIKAALTNPVKSLKSE